MHDTNKPNDSPANLPTDIEQQVEDLAERFLEELQAGNSPDREQWVKANPQIAQSLAARLELVEKMFRMVHGKGLLPKQGQAGAADTRKGPDPDQPAPSPQPPERAIHLKCPHCGNRIQLVEPKAQEVLCENCGSSFELDPGTTTTYRPDDLPKAIGRFQVLELLGRGGFGAVYKARDAELDRTVAIKVARAGYFGTQQEQERFIREARSAARLKHPNIVPVHEIGHDRGVPYIVSDYIEGLTLADLLTAGRPTFRESAELVARIADALDYAHREKIIHRDIKPSNILLQVSGFGGAGVRVRGSGFRKERRKVRARSTKRADHGFAFLLFFPEPRTLTPYLADFGLARRDEGEITVTLDGQVLGTPAYMPPEQAAGDQRKVDARSDVYSLGVVLYELLTGELPFRGNKRMLLHQVLHDDPRPPRSLNDRIPRDLETICLKSMAKEPARRYTSAREFADDLRRWLAGESIAARPVGNAERLLRWCRRNPMVAALTGAVAITLLAGTVVSSFFAVRAYAAAKRADDKAAEARRNLYVSHMNLAQTVWEDARVARVLDLLKQHEPQSGEEDLRGFEWHYWNRLAHSYHMNLEGHTGEVNSVAFSADGKRLASASDDQTVKVWDATSGQETLTLKGHTGGVRSVAFSADRKRLASASDDQTVKVWDATSGQETLTLKGHTAPVFSVVFSADGKRLASASGDQTVKVWDATSGQETLTLKGHTDWVASVGFSADGKRLASASWDQTVKVWDARPWTPELRAEQEALSVVRFYSTPPTSNDELLARIRADATVSEPVRERALEFARQWPVGKD